jgi:hypothetical protein
MSKHFRRQIIRVTRKFKSPYKYNMSVRYRAPPAVKKAPVLYIIQPEIGDVFKDHYKIGRSETIDGRMQHYSTCYPKALGGFKVFGFLTTSKAENATSESRAFSLASKHNFERIDKKAEFFKYIGNDIHHDVKALLVETRGGRAGGIVVYDKNGHSKTIQGGHLDVDNIKPAPVATTRSTRIHDTYGGGRRVLRPKAVVK